MGNDLMLSFFIPFIFLQGSFLQFSPFGCDGLFFSIVFTDFKTFPKNSDNRVPTSSA